MLKINAILIGFNFHFLALNYVSIYIAPNFESYTKINLNAYIIMEDCSIMLWMFTIWNLSDKMWFETRCYP